MYGPGTYQQGQQGQFYVSNQQQQGYSQNQPQGYVNNQPQGYANNQQSFPYLAGAPQNYSGQFYPQQPIVLMPPQPQVNAFIQAPTKKKTSVCTAILYVLLIAFIAFLILCILSI